MLGTDATGIPVLDPGAPEGIRYGTIWAWTNARWVPDVAGERLTVIRALEYEAAIVRPLERQRG